jgi:gluconate 2-dehydrogenase gamma chain
MSDAAMKHSSRRGFLGTAAAAIAIGPALPLLDGFLLSLATPAAVSAAVVEEGSAAPSPSRYRCLNAEAAAFTEAMVNVLCPADDLTPDGVTCGLVTVIDQELARSSVRQARLFTDGISIANDACQRAFHMTFDRLPPLDAAAVLHALLAGDVQGGGPRLAAWAHDVVNPILMHACFVAQIYDDYSNRVFWKVFGHAGMRTI